MTAPHPDLAEPTTGDAAFADALSSAISRRGLPLERLQARLAAAGTPVSVATLSYWQTGRSVPRRRNSLRAVANLEQVLELAPHTLAELLCPERRSSPVDHLGLGARQAEVASRVLKAFDLSLVQPVQVLAVHATLELDPDPAGSRRVTKVRCRLQAAGGGPVDRLPSAMALPAPGGVHNVLMTTGFRLGREFRDHGAAVHVAELMLPRAYQPGEEFEVSATVECQGHPDLTDRFEWGIPASCQELRMSVDFGSRLPRHAARYCRRTTEPGTPSLLGDELAISDGIASFHDHDLTPGVRGIAWKW